MVERNPPARWTFRSVRSPLTDEMLSPFPSTEGSVAVRSMLTDAEFMRLGEWWATYPKLDLNVYGSNDITNLEFLRFFPFIHHLGAYDLYHSLQTLDGLGHLSGKLDSLSIGATKRQLDLTVLERLQGLKSLRLEAQTKGIATISTLTSLEEVWLRSVTLPDLSVLLPLGGLRALEITLGGTKDLSLLPSIGRLEYLELWMVKGLTDLSALGRLPHLRYLSLGALRRVEELPDLSMNVEMRRASLQTMKGLRNLRPLTTAPALEQLFLIDMGHLQPEDLRCLVGLPRLKGVTALLGSDRKNQVASAMLRLPNATGLKNGWREV
jgi:hypothetical protein